MSSNFFSLPRELRNMIYGPVLLQQEPIDPWHYCYRRGDLTPGLLRVNRAIHREASSLFYSQNRFDFTHSSSEHVASFLGQIGRVSADFIQHVCIDFPDFLPLEPGDVTLKDDSICILANFRNGCASLSTLTTSLYSTNAMELRLDALDNPKLVTEALKLVNTHFRAISSLQQIIVEVYEDGPSDQIRRVMKSHGWTIRTTEVVEEEASDRCFSDLDDPEYDYDSGSWHGGW